MRNSGFCLIYGRGFVAVVYVCFLWAVILGEVSTLVLKGNERSWPGSMIGNAGNYREIYLYTTSFCLFLFSLWKYALPLILNRNLETPWPVIPSSFRDIRLIFVKIKFSNCSCVVYVARALSRNFRSRFLTSLQQRKRTCRRITNKKVHRFVATINWN